MGSRFPEFQELHLGPERKYQVVTGTWELDFFISEFEDCCPFFGKETMTEQALPPALLLGIWRPEFSANPQCKLWRCSIQSELRYLPFSKMRFSLPSLLFCSCSLLYPGIPSPASSSIKTAISSISNSDALFSMTLLTLAEINHFKFFNVFLYIFYLSLYTVAYKVLFCVHCISSPYR